MNDNECPKCGSEVTPAEAAKNRYECPYCDFDPAVDPEVW